MRPRKSPCGSRAEARRKSPPCRRSYAFSGGGTVDDLPDLHMRPSTAASGRAFAASERRAPRCSRRAEAGCAQRFYRCESPLASASCARGGKAAQEIETRWRAGLARVADARNIALSRGGDFNARLNGSAAAWPAGHVRPLLRGSVVSLDRWYDKTCIRADSAPHSATATADF